jgi:hypothetical protein
MHKASSNWPPGAPPTPMAPMVALPTLTGTPPASTRKPGISTRPAAPGFSATVLAMPLVGLREEAEV